MNLRSHVRNVSRCLLVTSLAALAVAIVSSQSSQAAMMTFSGTTLTDDTVIINSYPTSNFGAAGQLDVGGGAGSRRSLLRYNLSSLAGETVTAATLKLTINNAAVGTYASGVVGIYTVSAANANWVEGINTSIGTANDGESTWGNKAYSATTPTPWAGSAGLSTSVTDFSSTPLTTFNVSSSAAIGTTYTINFPSVAFMQNWIDNPLMNGGFFLYSPSMESGGHLVRFGQSHLSTAPILEVTLQDPLPPAPEPSTLLLLAFGAFGLTRRAGRRSPRA